MYYKILAQQSVPYGSGNRIYSILRLTDNKTFTLGDIVRIDNLEVITYIGEDVSEGPQSEKYSIYFNTDAPGYMHHWLTDEELRPCGRLNEEEVRELLSEQRLDYVQLQRQLTLNNLLDENN